MPTFYTNTKTLEKMVNHTIDKSVDLFAMKNLVEGGEKTKIKQKLT